jgi:hypothetical protein
VCGDQCGETPSCLTSSTNIYSCFWTLVQHRPSLLTSAVILFFLVLFLFKFFLFCRGQQGGIPTDNGGGCRCRCPFQYQGFTIGTCILMIVSEVICTTTTRVLKAYSELDTSPPRTKTPKGVGPNILNCLLSRGFLYILKRDRIGRWSTFLSLYLVDYHSSYRRL